jgi:thioredoxin-related protein
MRSAGALMTTLFALGLTLHPTAVTRAGPAPQTPVFDDSVPADISHPDWFKRSFLDLHEDVREARAAGKTGIVVFFSTRTCSYCKVFLETTFAQPAIVQRVREQFDVIGLEVLSDLDLTSPAGDRRSVKDFVVEEKARFTPTLIFYGEGGRRLLSIVGFYPTEKFAAALDYVQEKAYESQSFRTFLGQREAASQTPRPMPQDHALFARPPHILDRRLAPSGRPLLVVFARPDCPPCEQFNRDVLHKPSIRALLGRVDTVQLNAADTSSVVLTPNGERLSPSAWAEALGLVYAPALVFFDEHGAEVVRADSLTLDYKMEGLLQYVLEKGYVAYPQFQYWRRHRAAVERAPEGNR